jgi:hypothetical protein
LGEPARALAINAERLIFEGMHPRWHYNPVCSNIRLELIGGFDAARVDRKEPQSVAGAKLLMNETALGVASKPEILGKKKAQGIFANRITVYSCILLIAALASYGLWMRKHSIFSCTANGYTGDRYIAYCDATGYGDYEHGSFWFGLEPSAQDFAKDADVLFLGNSRIQYAFSTAATANWFSAASVPYYLLGFTYYDGVSFAEALLGRVRPKAKVYVINLDDFFSQWESPPSMEVMHDPRAQSHYEIKRLWQSVHELICNTAPAICGHSYAIFRSRRSGSFSMSRGGFAPIAKQVSYDQGMSEDVVRSQSTVAIKFLSSLPVQKDCVILTIVPTAETKIGNAKAIATALHKDLVMPEIPELQTFDGSHLDQPSAERWSQAFFEAAAPEIHSCLEKLGGAHS